MLFSCGQAQRTVIALGVHPTSWSESCANASPDEGEPGAATTAPGFP